MSTQNTVPATKALVTVFDDLESATQVAQALIAAGFPQEKVELVTHDVHLESPEVETPAAHETTASVWAENLAKGSAAGASAGAIVGIFMPFPGSLLVGIFVGGVAGAFAGGAAGIDKAVNDDSINLPTLEEYEELVKNGECLVVVIGCHESVMQAEDIVRRMPHAQRHIHYVHGHAHHEHPTH